MRSSLTAFLKLESAAGLLLMAAAALAMVCANSAIAPDYYALFETEMRIGLGSFALSKSFSHWINDGLMAIFFLLIGLEIKREMLMGELSSVSQALLPAVAALGGMIVPALVYVWFNADNADALRGWAIPSATDIAFSLGVLALVGSRLPSSLKIFLTALAVIDDLGAIVIIALFYSSSLSVMALAVAVCAGGALYLLGKRKIPYMTLYLIVGFILWLAVLKSGVHATIAGVAIGLLMPLEVSNRHGKSLLSVLEHALHPWVAYGILPLFAFANAGVSLGGLSLQSLLDPVPLGIALGLFAGKQIGIFAFSWGLIKSGYARLPAGAGWAQFYGVCMIAGIGFTMSLFIGMLAFAQVNMLYYTEVKVGVLAGSLLSAVVGYAVLRLAPAKQ